MQIDFFFIGKAMMRRLQWAVFPLDAFGFTLFVWLLAACQNLYQTFLFPHRMTQKHIMNKPHSGLLTSLLFIALLFTAIPAFSSDALDAGQGITAAGWVNIYVGNPELAGVMVRQHPLEKHKGISYQGQHPFVISFVMWNGTVNETYYKPDGRIISAGWWRLKDMKALDPQSIWHYVDFSLGSDPTFNKHKDPRNKSWKPPVCAALPVTAQT